MEQGLGGEKMEENIFRDEALATEASMMDIPRLKKVARIIDIRLSAICRCVEAVVTIVLAGPLYSYITGTFNGFRMVLVLLFALFALISMIAIVGLINHVKDSFNPYGKNYALRTFAGVLAKTVFCCFYVVAYSVFYTGR